MAGIDGKAHQHLILQPAIHSFTELPTAVSVDIWTRVKEVVTPLDDILLVDLAAWHWAVSTLHELATLNRNNQLVERYLSQEERSNSTW